MLRIRPNGKRWHTVPDVCRGRGPCRAQTLFQFSAPTALVLGAAGGTAFARFVVGGGESVHLGGLIFVGLSGFVLASG